MITSFFQLLTLEKSTFFKTKKKKRKRNKSIKINKKTTEKTNKKTNFIHPKVNDLISIPCLSNEPANYASNVRIIKLQKDS